MQSQCRVNSKIMELIAKDNRMVSTIERFSHLNSIKSAQTKALSFRSMVKTIGMIKWELTH